jgi:hypothetical protein
MTDAIRYGEDRDGATQRLRFAEALVRDYVPNGAGIAQLIRERLANDLKAIPAEGLAEIAAKMSRTNTLFNVARLLEQAAFEETLRTFDNLDPDAKSFLGAVLDFVGVDRKGFALAWKSNDVLPSPGQADQSHVSQTEPASGEITEIKSPNADRIDRLI